MIQLREPIIDNEMTYDIITRKKSCKNRHCNTCKLSKKMCKSCIYGNRGKMQHLRNKVFERYQFYHQNKNNLNVIQSINMMNPEEIEVISSSYKKSKEYQRVKKELFENIPIERRGLCPFCMISEPTTMDHYFQEKDYPEYILFAPNLVPCCSYCNSKKGSRVFVYGNNLNKRRVLHFYYDKIPQMQYLKASFYVENKIPRITFFLEFQEKSEITEIIKCHFKTLNLLERYRNRSDGILSTVCADIEMWLNTGRSIKECIDLLKIKAKSLKKINGNNYWEACIYEEMSRNENQLAKII